MSAKNKLSVVIFASALGFSISSVDANEENLKQDSNGVSAATRPVKCETTATTVLKNSHAKKSLMQEREQQQVKFTGPTSGSADAPPNEFQRNIKVYSMPQHAAAAGLSEKMKPKGGAISSSGQSTDESDHLRGTSNSGSCRLPRRYLFTRERMSDFGEDGYKWSSNLDLDRGHKWGRHP